LTDLDGDVRLHVLRRFVEIGAPPTIAETAAELRVADVEVEEALRRLDAAHVLVLAPGSLAVWMAAPFSGVPTAFRVTVGSRSYYGNCIWDGLGIVALLGGTGHVATACGDCGEPLEVAVADGTLAPVDGVAHFAVPARHWWDDIGFT